MKKWRLVVYSLVMHTITAQSVEKILLRHLADAGNDVTAKQEGLKHNENPELEQALHASIYEVGVPLSDDTILIADALVKAVSRTIADIVNAQVRS